MRKFIMKQELRLMEMANRAKGFSQRKVNQLMELMADNRGDEISTSHMVWVILVVVIVLTVGAALIGIFINFIIPGVSAKLSDIFNLG